MSKWRTSGLWWWLLLPMFFQIFHYKQEAGPIYYLAKLWPVLLFPLILYAMLALRLPDGPAYLLLAAYTIFLTPVLSLLYLPNGLVDALLSTVKAWPLTFYFSFAAALILLRPSEETLARAAVGCGVATFVVMVLMWVVVPAEAFQPTPFGANLFSWDEGRGNYIRMPMMLAEVALFWLGQRLAREWRLWQFLLLIGAIVAMITIYKARLPTGVSIIILTWVLLARLPGRWRWGLGALAMVPALGVIMIVGPQVPELLARTFDESLFIRLRSVAMAWDWMSGDPVKLLLGSGSISSFSSITMADFLGNAEFFLADIGWLGVVMEYGLVGTALIAFVHLRALATAHAVRDDDPFRCALLNYVMFELMCSAVYSVMYAPGPVVTVAAIAYWLRVRDAAGMARDQPGWPGAPAAARIETPAWAQGRVPVPRHFSRSA
ncbi:MULTISPECIES: hypothetical protein [Roseomonadaceae]|uniref:O-antigen ligase domain-containing protein n=1 Tax=Falsiroseomonas oleicola TaxID=2801474 RepID=A0ABS6H8U8_9PROT|nr:hypothetical protein [Roseomonas oleicola]MBU8544874.1 hypothetical protein [Roseomonas oleicola]